LKSPQDKLTILLIGLLTGFTSGLLGVGGAVILIPALTINLKIEQKKAQGTALLLIPLIAVASIFNYYRADNINLAYAVWLAAGSMMGILFGTTIAHNTPSPLLKKLFAGFMIFISIKMFIG
jgi:uncharacterized membrane protein YfcA